MALVIKNGENEIRVTFDHLDASELYKFLFKTFGDNVMFLTSNVDNDCKRCTVATISLNGSPCVSGISLCSSVDNFCKSTGRRIALTRAIKNAKNIDVDGLVIDKELSSRIWANYLSSCK